ncbi:hypothetical protein [Brevibacillus laterosporus]|uniref:hypothetical protein n=1 Tax=Brevibacillus laterosporus TaxID=1465 RepID=UPI000EB244EC|nr:hypothetical protein [Brevibacillus laterosporus]AYK08670.1 hypothetical protein D8Z77_21215 [Brevibacillus laterosporus]
MFKKFVVGTLALGLMSGFGGSFVSAATIDSAQEQQIVKAQIRTGDLFVVPGGQPVPLYSMRNISYVVISGNSHLEVYKNPYNQTWYMRADSQFTGGYIKLLLDGEDEIVYKVYRR